MSCLRILILSCLIRESGRVRRGSAQKTIKTGARKHGRRPNVFCSRRPARAKYRRFENCCTRESEQTVWAQMWWKDRVAVDIYIYGFCICPDTNNHLARCCRGAARQCHALPCDNQKQREQNAPDRFEGFSHHGATISRTDAQPPPKTKTPCPKPDRVAILQC